jgi:hypothetical protein
LVVRQNKGLLQGNCHGVEWQRRGPPTLCALC